MSELNRERSQRVRERYQQLEEQARPQRPVMVSSLRSFSYDLPTQYAEVERMMRARSDSPAPAPVPSPIPLAESPPPLSELRGPVTTYLQDRFTLQEEPQQSVVFHQQEALEQNLAEQQAKSQQCGKAEEQQPAQQLDTQPGQTVLPSEPLSWEQEVL